MSWVSNTGKLLVIGAGLVAWLDVSGPAKVQGWAERAKARRDETTERWNQHLDLGVKALLARMSMLVCE
jgi:hypothetical protein